MSHPIGTRLHIRLDEVLFREGQDPYEPKWAIAVDDGGRSYLLYGVRHRIPARVGLRAVMECSAEDRWVLIEEVG